MVYLDSQIFSRGVLYFMELSLDFIARYYFQQRNTLSHKNTLILNIDFVKRITGTLYLPIAQYT